MVTQDDVRQFLQDFKIKHGIWGNIFRDDRGKNFQTLLDLDITSLYREKIIKELEVKDYSEGPIDDILNNGAPMWVFGKRIKGKEVYIKITMGINGAKTICISFHVAENAMKYPFKNTDL